MATEVAEAADAEVAIKAADAEIAAKAGQPAAEKQVEAPRMEAAASEMVMLMLLMLLMMRGAECGFL